MTGFSLCHVSTVKENKNVRPSWMHLGVGNLIQNVKFQVHAVYLNCASSGCHSLRELIMVGYITYIMTGSVKPSGGKTTNQVSREPECFPLPWSKDFCTVTLDILSARYFRKGVDIIMQIKCLQ